MSEWTSCQAKLNEAGNVLIEVTESSTSLALSEKLRRVNMQWAECMKRTKFVSMTALTDPFTRATKGIEDVVEAGLQICEMLSKSQVCL